MIAKSDLVQVWDKVKVAPALSSKEDAWDQFVDGASTTSAVASSMIVAATELNLMEQFKQSIPTLMKLLDAVSKVHPFIQVAMIPFQTVYAMEIRREENNRKVILLFIEMRDMMAVLLQLYDLKDQDVTLYEGETIMGRMQSVLEETGKDILQVYGVCSKYSNERLICRVLKSSHWEDKLTECVGCIVKRKAQIEMALSAHAARGVDEANGRLEYIQGKIARLDTFLRRTLEKLSTTEEQDIEAFVDQYSGGREKLRQDDKALKRLYDMELGYKQPNSQLNPLSDISTSKNSRPILNVPSALDKLKEDLKETVTESIEKSLIIFIPKLHIEMQRVEAGLTRTVERTGDRVITALSRGPHELLTNQDMYQIWSFMGWRASVKSGHFVLALRDYYQNGSSTAKHALAIHSLLGAQMDSVASSGEAATDIAINEGDGHKVEDSQRGIDFCPSISAEDDWTLQYLRVNRLRLVLDTIDVDASGFITVYEVNAFTQSRPPNWSLLKWICFWTIGWQVSCSKYAKAIKTILQQMFALLPRTLPQNRGYLDDYLIYWWDFITKLWMSVPDISDSEYPEEPFSEFVRHEEERLRNSLEKVSWHIEAPDTLQILAGGPLEHSIMPLMYLLLNRHLQIFQICRLRVVQKQDIQEAKDTLYWIYDAHRSRALDIGDHFRHQRRDPEKELKMFAGGLYQHALDKYARSEFPSAVLKELSNTATDVPAMPQGAVENVLRYGVNINAHPEIDYDAYDLPTRPDQEIGTSWPMSEILGEWTSFTTLSDNIVHYNILPSSTGKFVATGCHFDLDFNVTGECSSIGGQVHIVLEKQYVVDEYPVRYIGRLDPSGVFRGSFSFLSEPGPHGLFSFKRINPMLLYRPPQTEFDKNKSRALWRYAGAAVLDDIRRQSWSWAFFRDRFRIRKRFIHLLLREAMVGQRTSELENIIHGLPQQDFYISIFKEKLALSAAHLQNCDVCGRTDLHGIRIICLDCPPSDSKGNIDLCATVRCVNAEIPLTIRGDLPKPHLPTHSLLRVPFILHLPMMPKVFESAQAALVRVKDLFDGAEEVKESDRSMSSLRRKTALKLYEEKLRCTVCDKPVLPPCWYCVECEDHVVLCNDCGIEEVHHETHFLVRYSKQVDIRDDVPSVEQRLRHLEEKLEGVAKVEDVQQMRDRLASVEKLLETILGHISPASEPTS